MEVVVYMTWVKNQNEEYFQDYFYVCKQYPGITMSHWPKEIISLKKAIVLDMYSHTSDLDEYEMLHLRQHQSFLFHLFYNKY